MSVKSGQALACTFVTSNPTTGAVADATGTPTATLYVNGVADAATVTVTKPTGTGLYKAAVTLPTLTAGDTVSILAFATVATVAGAATIFEDVADTKRVSDLNDAAAAPSAADIKTALEAAGSHLDRIKAYFYNKRVHTASQVVVYADDGTTPAETMAVTGSSTTVTKGAAS